jgi:hypothetical protein
LSSGSGLAHGTKSFGKSFQFSSSAPKLSRLGAQLTDLGIGTAKSYAGEKGLTSAYDYYMNKDKP